MDHIDRKILHHLQRKGRDSYAEIGAAVDLSVSAVNERLKKLEASGALAAWSVVVDPEKVGRPTLAFVSVALGGPSHDGRAVTAGTPG